MNNKLGVGIIGLGIHGGRYANHILQGDAPSAELIAVNRRDATQGEAFAAEHGCRYCASADELLADDDIDIVIITTPPNIHAELTVKAASAGKHVLCEKPMARTVDECRAMIDATGRAGVKLGVGQTVRFTPLLGALRNELPSVGDLYAVNATMRHERTQKAWHLQSDIAGGGIVLELGVHVFDTVRYLTGENIVRVFAETRDTYNAGVETYATAIGWLENGPTVGMEIAKSVDGRCAQFEFVGSDGSVVADVNRNTLTRTHGRDATPIEPPENAWAIPLLVEQFCRAVLEDGEPDVSGLDGLHTIAVGQAIYRSAASGVPEPVTI